MRDFEKFNEELLSKEKFYSSLTDRKLSGHVLNVMRMFLTFGQILQWKRRRLSWLVFRMWPFIISWFFKKNNSLKNYGLCPSYYLSTPGLTWDAMPKMTKIELELIPDLDMYIIFEQGTRGRISYILIDTAKPTINIKNLDPKQESRHVIYLDANNIYSIYAKSKFLPTSGCKWIDAKEFNLN